MSEILYYNLKTIYRERLHDMSSCVQLFKVLVWKFVILNKAEQIDLCCSDYVHDITSASKSLKQCLQRSSQQRLGTQDVL